jgi:hypothetical protein
MVYKTSLLHKIEWKSAEKYPFFKHACNSPIQGDTGHIG